MSNNATAWGGGLREARLAAGLSQQAVAARARCSVSYLRVLERGCIPATSNVVPRVLAVLAGDDQLDATVGAVAHHDEDRNLSIPELRALIALDLDLRWGELRLRRESRAITIATAMGWVGVTMRILVVVGIAALALGVADPSDALELLRGPR